jgi:uncharacterized protein YgiM (DUF1202 family)
MYGNKYKILRRLGKGSHGTVVLAEDQETFEQVCYNVNNPTWLSDNDIGGSKETASELLLIRGKPVFERTSGKQQFAGCFK